MSKKQGTVIGECCICGAHGPLSEEHVPPKAAYNKARVIEYELQDAVADTKKKGRIRQGGVSRHTLCEQCNNSTGHWYGDEYVTWAKVCMGLIQSYKQHRTEQGTVVLCGVFPLRFLKQAVTCVFSVIGEYTYARNNPGLVGFVLDKYNQALPPDYHLFLDLYPFSDVQNTQLRRIPLAGRLTIEQDAAGNIRPVHASVLTEMAHPPFRLIMTQDQSFPGSTEITHFKDYGYDERVDITMKLRMIGSSSPFPGSLG